jgi:peptidyl-prolyl cis-trans isomerase B (cyclophilin B)
MSKRVWLLGCFVLGLWGASADAADRVIFQFERKGKVLDPVVLALYEGDAPKHALNFKKLVRRNFYRKMAVHRVVPGTLVQLGDPLSRRKDKVDLGTGGPGYTLAPEIGRRHVRGAVGMGRLPDAVNPARLSNGSQFYVVLKPLPELDGKQTVFGEVVEGLTVWESIGSALTDTNDSPVDAVVVRRAMVVPEERVEAELARLRELEKKPKVSWWNWLKRVFRISS